VIWGYLFLDFVLAKGTERKHIVLAETIASYQRIIIVGKEPCIKLFSD